MTTFVEALLWGTGLSLGICVGLVAWIFLREATYRILGIHKIVDEARQHGIDCLGALLDRNSIGATTNEIWVRIENLMIEAQLIRSERKE